MRWKNWSQENIVHNALGNVTYDLRRIEHAPTSRRVKLLIYDALEQLEQAKLALFGEVPRAKSSSKVRKPS